MWRLDAFKWFLRIKFLGKWLLPTVANRLVAPALLHAVDHPGAAGWMCEVLTMIGEYGLDEPWREILERAREPRCSMAQEEADKLARLWEVAVNQAVGAAERRWQLGDGTALAQHGAVGADGRRGVHWPDLDGVPIVTAHTRKVLRLCNGRKGWAGAMVLRNKLCYPGQEPGECRLCGAAGGETMRHAMFECAAVAEYRTAQDEEEWGCAPELVRLTENKIFPFNLREEEATMLQERACKAYVAMKELNKDEDDKE